MGLHHSRFQCQVYDSQGTLLNEEQEHKFLKFTQKKLQVKANSKLKMVFKIKNTILPFENINIDAITQDLIGCTTLIEIHQTDIPQRKGISLLNQILTLRFFEVHTLVMKVSNRAQFQNSEQEIQQIIQQSQSRQPLNQIQNFQESQVQSPYNIPFGYDQQQTIQTNYLSNLQNLTLDIEGDFYDDGIIDHLFQSYFLQIKQIIFSYSSDQYTECSLPFLHMMQYFPNIQHLSIELKPITKEILTQLVILINKSIALQYLRIKLSNNKLVDQAIIPLFKGLMQTKYLRTIVVDLHNNKILSQTFISLFQWIGQNVDLQNLELCLTNNTVIPECLVGLGQMINSLENIQNVVILTDEAIESGLVELARILRDLSIVRNCKVKLQCKSSLQEKINTIIHEL